MLVGSEKIPPEVANTIHLHDRDLIAGGDTLFMVPLGEDAARADFNEILELKGGTRRVASKDRDHAAKVEDCAALLTGIVEGYSLLSCGYGTNRELSKDP